MNPLTAAFKKTSIYRNFFGHKKFHFITELKKGAALLDIGCGNHSPSIYKGLNPGIEYVGLDIEEYFMDENDYKIASKIVFVDRHAFAESIKGMGMSFDAVVSAHNLEHTDKPFDVIEAMMFSLKKGGRLYLSFPTERSAFFPKRKGTLNFYDDPTHNYLPNVDKVCSEIIKHHGKVVFARKRYRAAFGFIKGALQEPVSWVTKKNYSNTWNFWGFETVIIAEKV
ncbi:hypothetical protein BH10BAC4_BH10BAC4_13610 [soil metagenome]